MKRLLAIAVTIEALLACGCAAGGAGKSTAPIATTQPAGSTGGSASLLRLEDIEPKPVLPHARPTTAPTSRPSLEAIETYARAREAQLQNQRFTAITLLEKAISLDKDSFELNYALGRAYLTAGGSAERAIAAFLRAAEIKPNDLSVQTELGRAYQSRNDLVAAIDRFRLAMLTDEYRQDDPLAAVVDYRLGVALQQAGYDQAALQCYESLLHRIEHPSSSTRTTAEINYLLARPESLYDEMGKLYERLGRLSEALGCYRSVAERSASEFDPGARVVRTLSKMKRHDEARTASADLVRQFHASAESLRLLTETYRVAGSSAALGDALRRLHAEQPHDRAILFALADTLASTGKLDDSRALLSRAVSDFQGDVEIVERLWHSYADRDDVSAAAKLLIRVTAAHPDTTVEVQPMFADLMRLSRKNSLRVTTLQKLEVPASDQAARQYWLWRAATVWTRPTTARAALAAAAKASPPFDPACRALLNHYLNRPDWDDAARYRAAEEFIDSVQSRGRADLAAELRGLVALHQQQVEPAIQLLGNAIEQSSRPSPDLQLEYALAQLRQGNSPRFEQLMWKLVSDRPRFETGYQLLINYYKQSNLHAKAWNVIEKWLVADPNITGARLQQATELLQQRRGDEALEVVQKLFSQRPDDGEVVTALVLLLNAAGQSQRAIDLLEAERVQHPGNRTAVEALTEIYAGQDRVADATRVLDAARVAVAGDPDLLYYIAHLYQRISQQEMTEQVLQEVMRLDPSHAQAGNDLGYTWADAGKNLEQAEAMIRLAVDAEPDNPSYLDSLGWVLYKRGHFEQARKLLEQAAEPAESADPVVLDHLGDALYQLEAHAGARSAWQQSLQRADGVPERDEIKELRLKLQAKLKQADAGQPVTVAPVVGQGPAKTQAKN